MIDPTWPEGGSEYFGVPFRTDYVRGIGKGRPISTLLDRYWDKFPLLRKLGTRPRNLATEEVCRARFLEAVEAEGILKAPKQKEL